MEKQVWRCAKKFDTKEKKKEEFESFESYETPHSWQIEQVCCEPVKPPL
jgi:hypothetical protein